MKNVILLASLITLFYSGLGQVALASPQQVGVAVGHYSGVDRKLLNGVSLLPIFEASMLGSFAPYQIADKSLVSLDKADKTRWEHVIVEHVLKNIAKKSSFLGLQSLKAYVADKYIKIADVSLPQVQRAQYAGRLKLGNTDFQILIAGVTVDNDSQIIVKSSLWDKLTIFERALFRVFSIYYSIAQRRDVEKLQALALTSFAENFDKMESEEFMGLIQEAFQLGQLADEDLQWSKGIKVSDATQAENMTCGIISQNKFEDRPNNKARFDFSTTDGSTIRLEMYTADLGSIIEKINAVSSTLKTTSMAAIYSGASQDTVKLLCFDEWSSKASGQTRLLLSHIAVIYKENIADFQAAHAHAGSELNGILSQIQLKSLQRKFELVANAHRASRTFEEVDAYVGKVEELNMMIGSEEMYRSMDNPPARTLLELPDTELGNLTQEVRIDFSFVNFADFPEALDVTNENPTLEIVPMQDDGGTVSPAADLVDPGFKKLM